MDEREYTLMEHLSDLRKYLFRAVVGVLVISLVVFNFSADLLDILRMPMQKILNQVSGDQARFVILHPAEYLMAQLKVSMLFGLFISSPWVFYQLWQFVSPGLHDHEKRYAISFVTAGAIFFCLGAAFAYFVVFPLVLDFFVSSLPKEIMMTPSLSEHLDFSMKTMLAFGIIFEVPVVVFIFSVAGIIDPHGLSKYRGHMVVVSFVIGAVLTPPDVVSQIAMSLPLIILYELGGFAARLFVKKGEDAPLSKAGRAAARAADGDAEE